MSPDLEVLTLLMAEDDDDDFMLAHKAFLKTGTQHKLRRVVNGEDLLDYLERRGIYASSPASDQPCFILLDLNMPRKDGREALRDIKAHPRFKKIPVIVFTTSESEEDVAIAYSLGANAFIRKPVNFEELVGVMKSLMDYWLGPVILPGDA